MSCFRNCKSTFLNDGIPILPNCHTFVICRNILFTFVRKRKRAIRSCIQLYKRWLNSTTKLIMRLIWNKMAALQNAPNYRSPRSVNRQTDDLEATFYQYRTLGLHLKEILHDLFVKFYLKFNPVVLAYCIFTCILSIVLKTCLSSQADTSITINVSTRTLVHHVIIIEQRMF